MFESLSPRSRITRASRETLPGFLRGVPAYWWRRRDSCSISFETGWTMPSSDPRAIEHRSGACYPHRQPIRILVQAPCVGTQPVYESLQGEGSWPSRTPRRCHVARRRTTQGSPIEPRYHFALAGKGDHCVNRTRVRKPSAISSTCVAASIVLTGGNPTSRVSRRRVRKVLAAESRTYPAAIL